ncbi:MAG: TldD/PmbA family protein [Chloroflexi bacterium]|nr:MAG: TldD/PmbA family protein [Chloroflexota bacterium]
MSLPTTLRAMSSLDLSPVAAAEAQRLRERFGFLREVVEEMERSVPYASALVRFSDGQSIDLRDGEQSASRQDPHSGVVLTASNGHALEESASDAIDAESVRGTARELVARVRHHHEDGPEPELAIQADGPGDADFATPVAVDPATVPLTERIARYEALRQRLRAVDDRAVQSMAIHREGSQTSIFANRSGMTTQQIRRVVLILQLFVSDGQQRQFDVVIKAGTGGLELLDVTDEELAECAATAASLLSAGSVSPGTHDIIADPQTTGTIAHEAFGHGVETDMFVKERARAADYVGRRVGSELVNILDDPTVPTAYGSYFVDDEGQLASGTAIIRDGVFQRGITDLYSATRLGIPRSANGRRESVQRKAYARMSNTFFAAGDSTLDALIAGLDDGLLVCRALNGMEDPKGWGIQIWSNFAREIKHGRLTGTVYSPIALTGYVPDLLADVSGISDTIEWSSGSCGKGWKEIVPVGSGGPYLRTRCRLG